MKRRIQSTATGRTDRVAVFMLLTGIVLATIRPASADDRGTNGARAPTFSSLSRETGAVYLDDLFDKPIRLEVLKPAPIFSDLSGRRSLGTLLAGQTVTLDAISKRAYRVRGRAKQGGVVGWVGPAFLKAPTDDFHASITKLYERQREVEELIAKREVALGMTVAETVASLGKPQEQESSSDADGIRESLAWIIYKRVPQTSLRRDVYGRLFRTTIYVKVETGRRTVHFEDGIAARIDEKERDPRAGRVRIVPSPIILFR